MWNYLYRATHVPLILLSMIGVAVLLLALFGPVAWFYFLGYSLGQRG